MVTVKQNTVCVKGVAIQISTALLIASAATASAIASAWPSYSLRVLQSDASPLSDQLSEIHCSLIGSLMMIGSLVSPVLVAYSAEHYGRRITLMLCVSCFMIGWVIKAVAKTVLHILIARLIMGVGYGMQSIIGVVYISEISQSSLIGPLCSVGTFMFSSGILISYILGWFLSYEMIIYSMIAADAGLIMMVLLIKDSPDYLLRKGLEREALASLKFYRGVSTATPGVLDELEYLKTLQELNDTIRPVVAEANEEEIQKLNGTKEGTDYDRTRRSAWQMIRASKALQRSLANVTISMACTILMGTMGVVTYAGDMFTLAAPSLSRDLCSVLLAVVLASGCGTSVIIMDLVPRRKLMISSSLLAAVILVLLAGQLRWSLAPEWSAPLGVVLFAATYCSGITSVPYVQIGECFPSEVKSFVTSVIVFCAVSSTFVVLFLFPYGVQYIGLDGTFLVLAIICLGTAVISYFIMRETRNVPVEVIQGTFEDSFFYKRRSM